jgi:hypothetical protein
MDCVLNVFLHQAKAETKVWLKENVKIERVDDLEQISADLTLYGIPVNQPRIETREF